MAVAQKAISRGVSEIETPTFDLNHCRFPSTSEINAIGVLQMKEANRTRSSKACSGSVSRMAYLWRAATRAASFSIVLGVAIDPRPARAALARSNEQRTSSKWYTELRPFSFGAQFFEPFCRSESFATHRTGACDAQMAVAVLLKDAAASSALSNISKILTSFVI